MTIDNIKKRWRNFYKEGGSKFVFKIEAPYAEGVYWPKWWPDRMKEREEFGVRLYEAQLERNRWLDDDSVPCIECLSGTEIYAEALGANVYRPDNDMPMARSIIQSPAQAAAFRVPKPEDTKLMNLFELARRMHDRCGKDAIMKIPDVQSPMDILAQLWDKTDLYTNITDEEELVLDLADRICDFLIRFWDLWFAEFGTSFIAHFPSYYMEGGFTLSADEIGCVSSEMYDRFFLGELNKISRHFGGIGIHCCADSEHQWEGLKRVEGLRMLNLAREFPVLERSYREFTHCAHFPTPIANNAGIGMPDFFPKDYPEGTRIVIVQNAATKEEGIRKAEVLRELCRMEDIGL